MTFFIFESAVILMLLTLEICFGNIGIVIPFTAGAVLYFAAVKGFFNGLAVAVFCGFVLDGVFCRNIPWDLFQLLLILAFSRPLQPEKFSRDHWLSVFFSVLTVTVFRIVYLFLMHAFSGSPAPSVWQTVIGLPFLLISGCGGFALLVLLLDFVLKRLNIDACFCCDRSAVEVVGVPRKRHVRRIYRRRNEK